MTTTNCVREKGTSECDGRRERAKNLAPSMPSVIGSCMGRSLANETAAHSLSLFFLFVWKCQIQWCFFFLVLIFLQYLPVSIIENWISKVVKDLFMTWKFTKSQRKFLYLASIHPATILKGSNRLFCESDQPSQRKFPYLASSHLATTHEPQTTLQGVACFYMRLELMVCTGWHR